MKKCPRCNGSGSYAGLLSHLLQALVVLVALTACGGRDSTLFPLTEGFFIEGENVVSTDAGKRTSTMRVSVLAPRELSGTVVSPLLSQFDGRPGSIGFYRKDNSGFYIVGRQYPGDVEPRLFEPPRQILRLPIQVGDQWQVGEETKLLAQGLPITITYEVVAIEETVTIASGTYSNCVRVDATGSAVFEYSSYTKVSIELSSSVWFAPGIGEIRWVYEEVSDNQFLVGNASWNFQLTSYGTEAPQR